MTTIIKTELSSFLGALTATDDRGLFVWLPGEVGKQLRDLATPCDDMNSSIDELTKHPEALDQVLGGRKGRALVYQGVRALIMSAGYRAHNVLCRIDLRKVGSTNAATHAELDRYKGWATGRELQLEDYLLGGVPFETKAEYKALVEGGASEEQRLQLLLDSHRVVQQAVQASWGMIYAERLSRWADKHGQVNAMIDQLIWGRSVAKLKILNTVTRGMLSLAGV